MAGRNLVNILLGVIVLAAVAGGAYLVLTNRTDAPPEPKDLTVAETTTLGHFVSTVEGASGDCPKEKLTTKGEKLQSDDAVSIAQGTITIGQGANAHTGQVQPDGTFEARSSDGSRTIRGRFEGTKGSGGSIVVLPGAADPAQRCTVGLTFTATLEQALY